MEATMQTRPGAAVRPAPLRHSPFAIRHSPLHRGFTLIELLVVIAIIAILAAILFPVFAQAREKARQSACASGTRQIGIAFSMYVQDFDEITPQIWYGPSSAQQLYIWPDVLTPYIKSTKFFSACPSRKFAEWNPNGTVAQRKQNLAYGANALYSTGDGPDGQATTPPMSEKGIPLASFQVPADTIVFGDALTGQYIAYSSNKTVTVVELNPPFTAPAMYPNVGRNTPVSDRFGAPHFSGANYVYADGHTKWMRLSEATKMNRNGIMHLFTVEDDQAW
jgi:prepilin-type N-terminal cleavage/methylation domain-containing protein/prepilin-type processing-associated H-X9-DG protein